MDVDYLRAEDRRRERERCACEKAGWACNCRDVLASRRAHLKDSPVGVGRVEGEEE